jgi:hypothetical protein
MMGNPFFLAEIATVVGIVETKFTVTANVESNRGLDKTRERTSCSPLTSMCAVCCFRSGA